MDPQDAPVDDLEQALLDIKDPADVNKVAAEVARRCIRYGMESCEALYKEGLSIDAALPQSEQEADAQYERILREVLTEYGHL